MACTCAACARVTIAILSVGFSLFSLGFFLGFVDMKDSQNWFKPIRNNCIPYYLIMVIVSLMMVYGFIGFILCFAKSKIIYYIYFSMVLILIFLNIFIIILTLSFKNSIFKTVEKKWFNQKYIENRHEFELEFKCCGFTNYDFKQDCGYYNQQVYLCGSFVESALILYLSQLRGVSIYLILIEILPTILASVLVCCNDENNDEDIKETESNTSMYSTLIYE